MLRLPKYRVFSVAEAYWPDPPSPTGENFLSFILCSVYIHVVVERVLSQISLLYTFFDFFDRDFSSKYDRS